MTVELSLTVVVGRLLWQSSVVARVGLSRPKRRIVPVVLGLCRGDY